MQALYAALAALGKSYEDARNGGWLCGALGDSIPNAPKCINGLLTFHLTSKPKMYGISTYIYSLTYMEDKMAAKLAAVALMETRPNFDEQILLDYDSQNPDLPWVMETFRNPRGATLDKLGSCLAQINDVEDQCGDPRLSGDSASAWFERAFDLLAKDLPEPLPALTVDEILAAGAPEV